MADDSPAPAKLPDFTPVPRAKDRSNGWKPHVQRAFIEALADTGSVRDAARAVRRSEVGAYQLRRHPEGAEFAAAWEVALDLGVRRIEDAALHRALNGVEVPVLSAGKQFGTRRIYNERLVMFILRNRRPEKYAENGARGLSAIDRMRLKRLKEEWRREWHDERRAHEPDIESVRAEILSRVAALDAHERKRWSRREHELHAELEAERARRAEREQEEARNRLRFYQPRQAFPGPGEEEPAGEPPALGADSAEAAAGESAASGEAPLDEGRARLLGLVEERARQLGGEEGSG